MDLTTIAVVASALLLNLAVHCAKKRVGLRNSYRVIVPWVVACFVLIVIVAWTKDRSKFPVVLDLLPCVLAGILALVEWLRLQAAIREGRVPIDRL